MRLPWAVSALGDSIDSGPVYAERDEGARMRARRSDRKAFSGYELGTGRLQGGRVDALFSGH